MLDFPFSFCGVECVFVANNGNLKSVDRAWQQHTSSLPVSLFTQIVPDLLHVYLGISLGLIANH